MYYIYIYREIYTYINSYRYSIFLHPFLASYHCQVVTDAWLCDSLLLGQRLPVSQRYLWREPETKPVEDWKLPCI